MSPVEDKEIALLRAALDGLDEEIVRLVAQRLELVGRIGQQKATSSTGIRDVERERQVLERVQAVARERGLSAALARNIFSEIISHSLTRQGAVLSPPPGGSRGGGVRVLGGGDPYTPPA